MYSASNARLREGRLSISFETIEVAANELGLELVGTIARASFEARMQVEGARLTEWQDSGGAAEMAYMKRPAALFSDLDKFLPGARSLIVCSIPYLNDPFPVSQLPAGYGRIARYAWGQDYHLVLREKLNAFLQILVRSQPSPVAGRVFSDAVPLLERALGDQAGLGFIGKNTLLIQPGRGSFSFIGEVLLDVAVEERSALSGGSCKSCFNCGSKCPTGAIESPFRLNANKCISYLTIEKRTLFEPWEEEAIGEWLFGCDICQDVCPFNHRGLELRGLSEFSADFGIGPHLSLEEVLKIRDDSAYKRRFSGTAILRAKREQLLRNALGITANTKNSALLLEIIELCSFDSSDLVRSAARRTLQRLHPFLDGLDAVRCSKALERAIPPLL